MHQREREAVEEHRADQLAAVDPRVGLADVAEPLVGSSDEQRCDAERPCLGNGGAAHQLAREVLHPTPGATLFELRHVAHPAEPPPMGHERHGEGDQIEDQASLDPSEHHQ